ncbi:hypothetical protein ACFUOZ_08860 [Paenarthrobacter sp. NPDC057355]|uniref:hypothetical protein n=1 Tax=Paenarthrobacter sp. NPDC057355 TaxID=3346105 RepID=UPI0036293E54
MDEGSTAFTVAFPEAKKTRTANTLATASLVVFWILWGIQSFGGSDVPDLPWFILGLISFGLFVGFSTYGWRRQKELVPLINQRFAEVFSAHTKEDYPKDVDILKVHRFVAVRRADGSVRLWGVKRKKDIFNVFPMT